MLELNFAIASASPVRSAVSPYMGFQVLITNPATEPTPIHAIVLRTEVRIEPANRRYVDSEKDRLVDLFGSPERWGKTVRSLLWAQVSTSVRPFDGETTVEVQAPCSFDFTLAATKYFDALEGGEIPLSFLFSGTIFYESDHAGLQVAQIPWDREAKFRLPVAQWKSLIQSYYPNSAWLSLRKETFDRLQRFKSQSGLPSCEEAIERLLGEPEAVAS